MAVMVQSSRVAIGALALSILVGTIADGPPARPVVMLGGYRVLAADFHAHSSMWSNGALTPFGLVLEAERQSLDVIAITGHNEVIDAKAGRWLTERVGGPTVLVGQEILTPEHHVIAVGIDRAVDSGLSVAQQIEDVHAQGGVAIAAHPMEPYWSSFDTATMGNLDGSEVCHPMAFGDAKAAAEFEAFNRRERLAAIGSSDFHGPGRMGWCRTYVFARDASTGAVLEGLRAHRTVVYGPGDAVHGDPALIALAETRPDLRAAATSRPASTPLDWLSRICGVVGLLVITSGSFIPKNGNK